MVRGGAPFGKGDGGIRKNTFLMGKSDASECNESSLSNCRVQLALSTRKDGMIIRYICHHHKGCNQTKDGEGTTQIYLNSIKSSEVDDANAKILAAL